MNPTFPFQGEGRGEGRRVPNKQNELCPSSLESPHCFLPVSLVSTVCAAHDDQLLFAYFKGNGEDGLHLATSDDGYTWTSLKGDKSFLKPTAGKDKLMRDPSVLFGSDGKFHMVWTVSWKERAIGARCPTI